MFGACQMFGLWDFVGPRSESGKTNRGPGKTKKGWVPPRIGVRGDGGGGTGCPRYDEGVGGSPGGWVWFVEGVCPVRPRPTVGTGCPRYDESKRGSPVGWEWLWGGRFRSLGFARENREGLRMAFASVRHAGLRVSGEGGGAQVACGLCSSGLRVGERTGVFRTGVAGAGKR